MKHEMNKEKIEVDGGSDNPFRNAGLPHPELENARAVLVAEVIGILNKQNLSKRKAAAITGIDPADIPRIRHADLKGFTIDRMIKVLESFNHRIEVKVRPIRSRKAEHEAFFHV